MTVKTLDNAGSDSRPWLWLTVPIVALLLIATIGGVANPDIYQRDTPFLTVQILAQDYFSLTVVALLLTICAILARRGSSRALILWIGALFYLLYNYIVYCFHVQFNALFPVYVGLFGCITYALIFGIAQADHAQAKACYGEDKPVRGFAVVLALMVPLFYTLQLGKVIPAIISGGVPVEAVEMGIPTDFTSVLDMAIYMPLTGLAAVMLWQRRPLGYTLGGAIFATYAIMMSMLVVTYLIEPRFGFDVVPGDIVLTVSLSALWIGLTTWYLLRMRR
ncbi:MAG: hypothetical protein JXJ17_06625 [Anaerolineae bacterium]|nr:hypothetical protein [Anaerolineae bacterium]